MRRRFKFKAFLGLVVIFALCILLPLVIKAPTDDNARPVKIEYSQKEFIAQLAPTAKELSKTYGVAASLLLAQAAYESNYGSSLLAVKYHNLYSMPAQAGQAHIRLNDQVYYQGKWQTQIVNFAVYDDWTASMTAYLDALRQGQWGQKTYKEVAGTTSNRVAAEALQKAGISSDPDYANKLLSIIESNQLSQYDR